MIYFYQITTSGLGCFFLTILLVPPIIKIATLIGALDYPGEIKIHTNPVPRLGGLAIFLSILSVMLFFPSIASHVPAKAKFLVLSGIGGIFLLGVIDDIKNLNAIVKLLFQIISVFLAVAGLFVLYHSPHIVYFFVIFLFILGITNAFNLIDGMDGLASGIAIFTSMGLLATSVLTKQQTAIWGASLIMGASLGFLIFNFNPAKIFLGDCGSTFLGFSIGLLISIIWLNSTHKLVCIPLLLIAGIPIFDTTSVIIRRIIKRKSLFMGDRNHIYDLLMKKGYNAKNTLLIIYIIAFVLSLSGTFIYIIIEY